MRNVLKHIFPGAMWTSTACSYAAVIFLKLLIFNVIWCLQTTFTAFSYPETYINSILATLLLVSPYMLTRSNRLQITVLFLIDITLVCNLMYSRTYNAAIPLASYGLAGNLSDFLPSVLDSMRWADLAFPLTTLAVVAYVVKRGKEPHKSRRFNRRYLAFTALVAAISCTMIWAKGGLTRAIERNQDANHYTCTIPMYTLWGNMLYESLQSKTEFTPQMQSEIDEWFSKQPAYKPLSDSIKGRTNLVVILCESLESWVLQRKVEGKEITPRLNRLLEEPTTLYAPHVLTQVKGGRSIDCQLLFNAGMLPIASGCYAVLYPNNTFYTLTKALKTAQKADACLLTVDKPVTWNQGMVAKAFGIDTLISKADWRLDEKVGSRKKLGDVSFMKQAVEKMQAGEVFTPGKSAFIQLVTYSGHNPFVLPENLQRIAFKGDYPDKMRDYMVMANYTDHALGILLDYLKTRPDYANTLVVITGDHEGLAADRATIRQTTVGRSIVSAQQFTPFIVVNSPVGMRYDGVMGQVDMYPTLLNLLHLDNYPWKGMGQSILDPSKAPVAVGSELNVEGDLTGVSSAEINRLKSAYRIADLMIRYNVYPRSTASHSVHPAAR